MTEPRQKTDHLPGVRVSGQPQDGVVGRHESAAPAAGPEPATNPGDQAAPGTPGTGEDVCPQCNGSGQVNGQACDSCAGTGKIVKAVGGA